jgi:cell division protein FtsW
LLIVLPAFLNMGVTTGLLPTKGMVLPLVAYGGSSLLASLFGVGLLLGLARHFHRTVR